MSIVEYDLCFAYAGTSLALVRSFAEHRAESLIERRTAIVEGSWILGSLFLFNNLHVAHHMRPAMPWYALPRWYAANRAALIERNGGLLYVTYFDVLRRYLLRPYDKALHPGLQTGEPAGETVPSHSSDAIATSTRPRASRFALSRTKRPVLGSRGVIAAACPGRMPESPGTSGRAA
jgi:fatty acid desaturase